MTFIILLINFFDKNILILKTKNNLLIKIFVKIKI